MLGVRLLVQERELAGARLDEERRSVAQQIRADFASRLERIALQQASSVGARPERLGWRSYGDSSVALVASVSGGRLVLPWEHDAVPGRSRTMVSQAPFAAALARAEQAEFASEHPSEAPSLYRDALSVARHPVQTARARLCLARALTKVGRRAEARSEYLRLIGTPPDVVDEHGIAYSLYSAAQLLGAGDEDVGVVSEALHETFSGDEWMAPAALHLILDLATRRAELATDGPTEVRHDALVAAVSRELERTERVLALTRDFASLGLSHLGDDAGYLRNRWVLYGSPAWLVGTVPASAEGTSLAVAVHAAPIFAWVEAEVARVRSLPVKIDFASAGASDADAESLGADLPGLIVRFGMDGGPRAVQAPMVRRWFYLAGLALVLGVTLFGGYLLWRDVQREVRVAELRSRFVSAVSHELKTPLTSIRMFAETLQMGRGADGNTRGEYLETIVNESERLTRLLNNVLDFSKIERGTKSYRREECRLGDIVRSTAQAMRYPLEQQGFDLKVEIADGLRTAWVDRDAIEQAILNLVDNAMKYSGDSRGVDLALACGNGEAIISVTDRGVGIAPEERDRIFERFYRAGGPEGHRVPGTGLGLTLVQHIARAHGGRVSVRSVLGEGSTFSLHLPWEEAVP